MTGPIPLWTLTLKRDERSSRPHFSSSNWAAIIRERFSYPFTPAVPVLHLSSVALTLILGEVDERFCWFESFLLMFAMLPATLVPWPAGSICHNNKQEKLHFSLYLQSTNLMTFPFVFV